MKYKNFSGSIVYSAPDKVLHRRVSELQDAIAYEGIDLCSLRENFAAAIEEYLRFCAEENRTAALPTR